jgi:NADPH:quinone reductase-like Zn-dependent oxidoreductase
VAIAWNHHADPEGDHARRKRNRGKLRPVIAATFPLADAAKAHVRGETGHVAGKIVLTVP